MGATQAKPSIIEYASEVIQTCETRAKESGSCELWFMDVDVDEQGCRKFPRLPEPGSHPRLMCTEDELPAFVARYLQSPVRNVLLKNCMDNLKTFHKHFGKISELSIDDRACPSREVVDSFFVIDSGRNGCFMTTFIHAFINKDKVLMDKLIEAIAFHATVVLRSKEIAVEQDIRSKPYDIWHSNYYDMNTGELFGGAIFALLYDFLHNFLSEPHQVLMRKAISAMTLGRRAWGMGWPARRIQSNWAPYHGDLLVLVAAIEGEEGYDAELFNLFEDLLYHFLDFSIYESGHAIEDAYNPNLALREGSAACLVMARRGFNLFRHPNYLKMWKNWMPFALEPQRNGEMYGGSSGSAFVYPASAVYAKYMYPKDPTIDFVYRHYICQNDTEYKRLDKVQTRWQTSLFALPALSDNKKENCPVQIPHGAVELDMPTSFQCLNRGKAILRSDWTEGAVSFTLDARPDGFLIGHDAPSRGAFVLNARGRRWGACPEWMHFKESSDYSLVSIDGVCQGTGDRPKASFCSMFKSTEGPNQSTFVATDLTYAYNWEWTQWIKPGQVPSGDGWELEEHDPRDFGMTSWWLPNKIYKEKNVGFTPLNQWRRKFNDVKTVTRSALMVRNAQDPFVLLCDEVQKDEEEHEYKWAMSMDEDVELESFDGHKAVLKSTTDAEACLVILILTPMKDVTAAIEKFSKRNTRKRLPDGSWDMIPARKLVFVTRGVSADFRLGFFPVPNVSNTPKATWKDSILSLEQAEGKTTQVNYHKHPPFNGITMTVQE